MYKVRKRDGKKVDFNGDKIALAIKKGFDSVNLFDEETGETKLKYNASDIQKVYAGVINTLDDKFSKEETIKIEEIQDIIEEQLKELKYDDVYESFSSYREKRSESRKVFSDDKQLHKFLKTLEELGLKTAVDTDLKRENANVDGDTPMGTMLHFGSSISKEFTKAYLIKDKFTKAHEEGTIHIHDLDFYAMGTTTCCQIDLKKLFKNGFSTGHGYLRSPKDIMSYSALAAITIQSNQNDQHGGQSIPAFDYYLAPGVLNTFKKQFKQTIVDLLDYTEFGKFINVNNLTKEIDKLTSIDVDLTMFDKYTKEANKLEELFGMSYEKALQKTNRITYQAMEAFVHNLNTMHSRAGAQVPFSSINFGTDTSLEGRMVIENYLLAVEAGLGNGETPIFPISIFKVKEGINYNEGDSNYDLFKLAMKVSSKRLFPNFSFLDSTFNIPLYEEGNPDTEVGYMGCRTRVMANVVDPSKAVTPGRGNLSFSTINLPRLGIKYGIINNKKADLKGFYNELEEVLDLVKNQLLDRFEIQIQKRRYNFPFLLGQGVWIDSEKLTNNDRIRKVLKHGTLSIGFIGLAECLNALIGEHHGESEKAQKLGLEIITFIRNKCDEYAAQHKLNFTTLATPAEGLSGRFTSIDRAIYGEIEGVTDKAYYTNSFHIPVHYGISIADKLKKEGPYHALTNAGHISYIELDGDPSENLEAFEKIIRMMKEANMGYGAINHPVDRDPVCGYIGIINDVCPRCGRKENEGVAIETLRNLENIA